MKDIPFTQYLRPDGRKREITIPRPDDVTEKAEEVIKLGGKFEAEELMTGEVSLTCAATLDDDEGEQDIVHELCSNGPAVLVAVDKLISDALAKIMEAR